MCDTTLDMVLRTINQTHRQQINLAVIAMRYFYVTNRKAFSAKPKITFNDVLDGIHNFFPVNRS